ncbi:MAG: NAD(P)/FAD-dependent oxidoreductase, partial [Anaerolineae bacterium]|nr:NAD(P)/FAD-dependent oxidoreductase [Anaerolineae bacterium]
GMAGLTASAFLARSGYRTLVCEKRPHCGGLVNSFQRNGFVFDGGIRALENSGILLPMLKNLGLDIPLVPNAVTLGIEDRVIRIDSVDSIAGYEALLIELYPESRDEIVEIVEQLRKIMHYMDIQYGIDNPVLLDPKKDREYFVKVILPWMFKYALTIGKVNALKVPVVDYLRRFTGNQSLLDIITQHFFRATPAFFALSYFTLYLDYRYPLGGTGTLPKELTAFVRSHGGTITTGTEIVSLDPERNTIQDAEGKTHTYRALVWAADLKALYRAVDLDVLNDPSTRQAIEQRRDEILDKSGGDSVLTLYLALDLDPDTFAQKASAHFFYTPTREGQSKAGPLPIDEPREAVENWLQDFLALTTYEISIPVLRDPALAPPGKTGLIVSVLFDYTLTRQTQEQGWYEDFKRLCETKMIDVLDASIFPGVKAAVLEAFSATPLTMASTMGTTEGAITGWAFTNHPVPAESRLHKVMASVRTPIPNVYQAGQWTFSPSGFPIAILSGKLAADQVGKALRKANR